MKLSIFSALPLVIAAGIAPALAQDVPAVDLPETPVVMNGITVSDHDYPYVKARCEELYRVSLDDQSGAETTKTADESSGGDDQMAPAGGDTENPQVVDEALTTFDLSTLTLELCQAAGLVDKP
jgi:hypothetical protein